MPFQRMIQTKFPPRLWALSGYPGSGKSTFVAQMRTPILPVDADGRFQEILPLIRGQVYELSPDPADNTDPDRINAILSQNMPGADVATIVVDSLTAIITPFVVQAMVDRDSGRIKNLSAAFRSKALAMRQIQDAVTRWRTDVLWIYHLQDGRDGRGQELTRATISRTELARLTRSINLQLEIVQEGERRGIKVAWARRGRSGITLWDDLGNWVGMPDHIEEAVYGGLSQEQQDQIEVTPPEVFPSPEVAIAWAMNQNVFTSLAHARNAYDKVKREKNPTSARQMAALWIADIQERLEQAS